MKKKLTIALISSLFWVSAAYADFGFDEDADFTGDAFFMMGSQARTSSNSSYGDSDSHTMPPVKKMRIKLKNWKYDRAQKKLQMAPVQDDTYAGEIETSEFASKEVEEKFEDEVNLENADVATVEEESDVAKPKKKKKVKKKNGKEVPAENIILDCDNVDYDAPNYLIKAQGNVNVRFVQQGITVKADLITFDRVNNTVKAEGNVKIIKNGHVVTGDYIFVDMNEETALIENPVANATSIEIRSKKGYVYGDKIVQEEGQLEIKDSYPIKFKSGRKGPRLSRMLLPKDTTLTDEMAKGAIKVKAKDIIITQKGAHEIISFKKLRVFKNEKTILKHPSLTFYTNQKRDYVENGSWEIGSYRGLGLYAGPGFVFTLPKGSVLKAMPILNYKSGLGVGAYGRFNSATNRTIGAYGTATEKAIVYGKQKLDDKLLLQYGMNAYMDEGFLGRRRPKYGVDLVYKDTYSTNNFLVKGQSASLMNRFDVGYYHDLDFDSHYRKTRGSHIGTTRFRYMANGMQTLYSYKDAENLKAFSLGLVGQVSASVYGTGDTQAIGRFGPSLHTQYKRWMQDVTYFVTAYDDNTPLRAFDRYRYGKQSLLLRESFRVCKYLTLSWIGSITLTDDSPNGKYFQENAYYISVGPDDLKFNIGYDYVRENLYCTVNVALDAKGTKVEYDKLEVKQSKKAPVEEKVVDKTIYRAPQGEQVLQKAVVQSMKVVEDVL